MKKFIVFLLLLILLGGVGYFAYVYLMEDDKNNNEKTSNKDKQYVLNKIADYTENNIEFYDGFEIFDGGYLFKYRTNDGESKFVIFDKSGKDITDTIYDFGENVSLGIRTFDDKFIVMESSANGKIIKSVVLDSKFNIILDKNNLIIESNIGDKYLKVTDSENSKTGIYNTSGNEVIPVTYQFLHKLDGMDYLLAQKDDKTGVIDFNNKVIIPFEYDAFVVRGVYYNAHAIGKDNKNILINKDGKARVIDINNKEIINVDTDSSAYVNYDISYSIKQDIYYVTFSKSYGNNSLVKIFDGTGKYIKDIELGSTYKLRINSYSDNMNYISYITFVDNNDISYKLNSNYALENIGKLYCMPDAATGSVYSCYYGGDITVKVNANNKYEVYNTSGAKLVNKEFSVLRFFKDYAYGCLDKNDNGGFNCGYFDYSGKILFDFKYDGNSTDKVVILRDESLYAVSFEKVKEAVGNLNEGNYFVPVKGLVMVDTNVNGNLKRSLYNLDGKLLIDNFYNFDGILGDKFASIEYYDKEDGYTTVIYDVNDFETPMFEYANLKKKLYHKTRAIYYGEGGIYELVEQ